MTARRFIAAALVLLWLSPSKAPAPIIESQEQPPVTQQPSKQKLKRRSTTQSEPAKTKSRSSASVAKLEGPARFAGAWTGDIKQGLFGHITATFTVSADAASVLMSGNMGGGTHPAVIEGNTISWSTGTLSATGNLTLNSDGQTAQFHLKGMLGSTSSTFRRAGAPPPPSTASAPTTGALPPPQGYDTVALRPSGSMSGPKPQMPPDAREHVSGVGVYLLHFDKPTGNLLDVTVTQSSGSTVLDQAAIATLRQWRATPGCPREVPFTVTYSVTSQ